MSRNAIKRLQPTLSTALCAGHVTYVCPYLNSQAPLKSPFDGLKSKHTYSNTDNSSVLILHVSHFRTLCDQIGTLAIMLRSTPAPSKFPSLDSPISVAHNNHYSE